MATKNNAAYRVHKVLAVAANKHPNQVTEQVWTEVFQIHEEDETRKAFEVSRCLNQLYDEIDIIEHLMRETDFSKGLYKQYLDNARHAIVPHGVRSGWNSYNGHLSSDTILSIKFCSEILPEEEQEINPEDIKEIEASIAELEATLADSSIPLVLKRIIESHIIKIKEALYSYNIVGAKSLAEVVKSAYGEVFENQAVFEAAKGTEPVRRLSKVWQKVKEVADGAKTANDSLSAGVEIVDKGVKVIGFIERIFSST